MVDVPTLAVKVPALAVPQPGSCASSGRAWRPRAARHSQGQRPGHWAPQPRPQMLERAALLSRVAPKLYGHLKRFECLANSAHMP